jgi:hypothetical protein
MLLQLLRPNVVAGVARVRDPLLELLPYRLVQQIRLFLEQPTRGRPAVEIHELPQEAKHAFGI